MEFLGHLARCLTEIATLVRMLITNGLRFMTLCTKSRAALAAENLFLRKQLAFYQERKVAPRRFDNASRYLLVLPSRWFAWKDALVNVTPKTLIGWHRAGFVVIEHGSRRLLHCRVTSHPTAQWTRQQLREAIPSDHCYRYLIHDRDSIFSRDLDQSIVNLGLQVLKTPYRSPKANSVCERTIGTMRREFLDYVIPLSEVHLGKLVEEWTVYFNQARPHSFPWPRPSRSARLHPGPITI